MFDTQKNQLFYKFSSVLFIIWLLSGTLFAQSLKKLTKKERQQLNRVGLLVIENNPSLHKAQLAIAESYNGTTVQVFGCSKQWSADEFNLLQEKTLNEVRSYLYSKYKNISFAVETVPELFSTLNSDSDPFEILLVEQTDYVHYSEDSFSSKEIIKRYGSIIKQSKLDALLFIEIGHKAGITCSDNLLAVAGPRTYVFYKIRVIDVVSGEAIFGKVIFSDQWSLDNINLNISEYEKFVKESTSDIFKKIMGKSTNGTKVSNDISHQNTESSKLAVITENLSETDSTEVRKLLEAGADVNVRNKYDFTPLLAAALKGETEIVKLLIEANCDINAARSSDNVTPLFMASQEGYTRIVKLLIEANCDINAVRSTDSVSALFMASKGGHIEVVKLLLAANANVNASDSGGFTPLSMAAVYGHSEIIKLLIEAGANIDASEKTYLMTPLYIASMKGNTVCVELLLESNANVIAATTDGETPLYVACRKEFVEIVNMLLAADENVNVVNEDGKTPLMCVSEKGNYEIAKLLVEANAGVNRARYNGVTPLHYAASEGHVDIVKLLLEANANINASTDNGTTPLYYASQDGHIEIIKLLLEANADVNIAKTDWSTPLVIASLFDQAEIVKLLLSAGADVNAKQYFKGKYYSALDWAQINRNSEISEVLKKYGAK